jgi:hypothetical protein
MIISDIAQKLERLAQEGRVSSEEMRKFREQEIMVEEQRKFFRGC